jgi:hypothetical protein
MVINATTTTTTKGNAGLRSKLISTSSMSIYGDKYYTRVYGQAMRVYDQNWKDVKMPGPEREKTWKKTLSYTHTFHSRCHGCEQFLFNPLSHVRTQEIIHVSGANLVEIRYDGARRG